MQDQGLPVGAGRAGQGVAGGGPLAGGQAAQVFAHASGGGDQDRGEQVAGGLGAADGVVPVAHEQPQRFAVAVGAQLAGAGAGEQFPGGAHGVDLVGFAGPALAQMPGGVDVGQLLAGAGQVAGQAQPVKPGAFDRPHQRPATCRGRRPGR